MAFIRFNRLALSLLLLSFFFRRINRLAATAFAQFFNQRGKVNLMRRQQYQTMVPKIGHFVNHFSLAVIFGGDNRFGRFFTDFFQDPVFAFGKQTTGVGPLLWILSPVFQHCKQFCQNLRSGKCWTFGLRRFRFAKPTTEAGIGAFVSGCARLLDFNQQRIPVAVIKQLFHHLNMARRSALVPEFLAASAIKPSRAGFQRFRQ